jgi:hypothetical protein
MDWREIASHRGWVGGIAAVILIAVWYVASYAPHLREREMLAARERALTTERVELERAIEEIRSAEPPPATATRLASPEAAALAPVDRLKYFLQSITEPANDLDLSYFTVTPLPPNATPAYEEIPFSIAVTGGYPELSDFLYQLEYQRDFLVRDVNLSRAEPAGVRADFQLAALLPRSTPPAATEPEKDPGRPTSLELARDPFTRAPAVLVTGADGRPAFLNVPPGLALSGIFSSGGRVAAIINHEPYRVGDVIENKRITRITRDGVEMTDDARTYFLEMPKPSVQRKNAVKEASRR